jgi:hypothetical protein
MNKYSINAVALAIGFAFSAGVMAQAISKDDYKAGKTRIGTEYKAAKAACSSLSGNPGDICVLEAKGKEKIARADLEASYKPSRKTQYNARVAKAEAEAAVAKERCDDLAGNAKDVCVKEAKAIETGAKADAKSQMKVSDANATFNEKTTDARGKAVEKGVAARKDASEDKTDAQYGVAKEKCDTFAGAAKDNCVIQAKARFGKS